MYDVALRLLRILVETLMYIHSKGILHLDLKPDNILVSNQGNPKIIDFGIGCRTLPETSEKCTIEGHVVGPCCYQGAGTLLYSPPEAFFGNVRYPQADVWSLGVTFFFSLTAEMCGIYLCLTLKLVI